MNVAKSYLPETPPLAAPTTRLAETRGWGCMPGEGLVTRLLLPVHSNQGSRSNGREVPKRTLNLAGY